MAVTGSRSLPPPPPQEDTIRELARSIGPVLRGRVLGCGILLALAAAAWGWVPGLSWTGIDALPLVEASRVASPSDLGRVLTQEYRANRASDGAFYRPIATLSHALDYAVWGLRPAGYHLEDLLLHLANALLLAALLNDGLGPMSRGASLAAAALFLVHPSVVETVPAVARRSDVLATTFLLACLLAIGRSWRTEDPRRRAWRAVALVAGLLALGSKEIAFPLPAVVAAMAAARGGGTAATRLRRAVREALPFAALLGGALALRVAFLGSIGGYKATELAGPLVLLRRTAGYALLLAAEMFDRARVVASPIASMRGEALPTELLLRILAIAIVGAAAWAMGAEVRRLAVNAGMGPGPSGGAESIGSPRRVAMEESFFLAAWLSAFAFLFAASNTFHSWYGYLPAAAAAGLLGSIGRWALLVLLAPGHPPRAAGFPATAAATAAFLSATALLVASPLLRVYPEWKSVSRGTDRVLAEVERLAPAWKKEAGLLMLAGIPCHVERPEEYPFRVGSAAGLWDYSIESWIRLRGLGAGEGPRLTSLANVHPSPRDASLYSLRAGVQSGWRLTLAADPPGILTSPDPGTVSRSIEADGTIVIAGNGFRESFPPSANPNEWEVRLEPPAQGQAAPKLWLFEAAGSRILDVWDFRGEPAPQVPMPTGHVREAPRDR